MEVLLDTTRSSDDTPDDTPDQAERGRFARVAVRRTGIAVVAGGLLVAITVVQSFVAWDASTADEHNYCSPGPQFAVLDATLHVEWLLALVVLIGAGCGAVLAVLGARKAGQAQERLGDMAGVELVVTLLAFAALVFCAAGYTFMLPYKCGL